MSNYTEDMERSLRLKDVQMDEDISKICIENLRGLETI